MGNIETKKNKKKELEKYLEKKRARSNIISSHSLFKVEGKVDIKPYQGDIDIVKLNKWLQ